MPAKKKAGWYSYQPKGKAHWWAPWEANGWFMHSRCGLGVFYTTLRKDPSHHRCKKCARPSRETALAAVVTDLKATGELDASAAMTICISEDLNATGELDAFGRTT